MAAIPLKVEEAPQNARARLVEMISVVVTCYNLERYIGECLTSVFGQTGAGDYEVIVVDDCSTDASANVISRFSAARYIRTQQNGGVLLATLDGIAVAQGDILCFLDGDDIWESDKLAVVRAAFDSRFRLGFVTHDLTFIDATGRPIVRRSRPAEVLAPLSQEAAGQAVRRGILFAEDFVWLGSALAVRASLTRLDEFAAWARQLPDPRNTYQDWPLAYWIASLDEVALEFIARPLFRYRIHGRNHSGDGSRPELMIRNIRRERNTIAAMKALAEEREVERATRAALERRLLIDDFWLSLYSGKRLEAARLLVRLLSHRGNGAAFVARETARLIGVATFGPGRFTRLKNSLALSRSE